MTPPTLDTVLTRLAADNATGSLRVGKDGTVYLTGGRVSYVECATTPGVEELLTASGRISASGVRGIRQASGPEADGGDLLVQKGVLSRGELEFCVLGATLDASFFLLRPAGTPRSRFKEGDTHWLGTHWYFDVPGLFRECERRRARLEQAWPSGELDGQAVVPVGRLNGGHVLLTASQWELVLAADSTATPLDLARRLGRPAYSTLLAVRELAAAGLLATSAEDEPGAPALPKRTPAKPSGDAAERRPPPLADATDVNLLIRLRDALEAL
ncbi:hypothetical protein GCM10023194_60850 [Planotetraspora phitsanulokensis]|uniref:Uncharacterized protein n=1 Tax=Planotetraspora phitsanulokensis TaxID=575192 RepID=A0A8J3U828_9ACTN|nr:hypothetical protein [Planotetraspora phitsanulokensis]GII37694.1 hypothetical protein Pph01_26970 [Planotetraspora phitsanulokensis]